MGGVPLGFALLVLAGCGPATPEETAASVGALEAETPGWVAQATEIERRGGRALVAGDPPALGPGTDVLAARPMGVLDGDRFEAAPGPVLAGRLLAGGVVWVTLGRALVVVDEAGTRTIDEDVLPELDVEPDGVVIAYARGAGEGAGVYLHDVRRGQTRLASDGLAVADRPLFAGEQLILVGAPPGGVAGVHVADWRDPTARPRVLTNEGLAAGQLGPSFVPPPASHASMRMEEGTLVYDDGEGERRVPISRGAP
jgi:hypothetical protein